MKLEQAIEILRKRNESDNLMPEVYLRLQKLIDEKNRKVEIE